MSTSPSSLAHIYDQIGMSDFARDLTPRLIEFAQQTDWLGRRVLDLGCGTGASSQWLANRGYATVGVDIDADMVQLARQAMPGAGLSLTWEQRDLRTIDVALGQFDMALAFDVLNEMPSLRDLEQSMQAVGRVLDEGKLFVFDLHTIQGLAARGGQPAVIIHDSEPLMVVAEHDYDHDRQALQIHYHIFQRQGAGWLRSHSQRLLRGYPLQAIATLLQRSGYDTIGMMTPDFQAYSPGARPAERVLFVARRLVR